MFENIAIILKMKLSKSLEKISAVRYNIL